MTVFFDDTPFFIATAMQATRLYAPATSLPAEKQAGLAHARPALIDNDNYVRKIL